MQNIVKDGDHKKAVRMNHDYEELRKLKFSKINKEFEASMKEDRRGPMEGMEEVPVTSSHPNPFKKFSKGSDSMLNEGGHS